ncbi:MAG: hypothetical protein IKP28_03545 [Clostridia bacterium]|nr:hypothetical protein [Clostridia bacterium]
MISRRTTLVVANILCNNFTKRSPDLNSMGFSVGSSYKVEANKLRDFLFEFNVDGYTIDNLCEDYYKKEYFKEMIMNIHTGIFYSRKEYKKYQSQGQSDLKNIVIGILYRNIQPESRETLENLLRIDGYIYEKEHLYEINTDIDDKVNIVKKLFNKFNLENEEEFDIFYRNMNEHFENSKWEDSIHNSRKLYELVLKECAKYYSINIEKTNKLFEKAQQVEIRKYLEDVKFFSEDELNIIRYFYKYMSNIGSHTKLALEEQADFSRVIAINTIMYSLRRLETYIDSKK